MKTALKETPLDPPQEAEKSKYEEKLVLFSHSALLESRLIEANDELVKGIEANLRRSGGMDDLFAGRMPQMEDDALLRIQEMSAGGVPPVSHWDGAGLS